MAPRYARRRTPARSVAPEPSTPDFKINIADNTQALTAFRGLPYPFTPTTTPCAP